jgi:Terminase DNA packaging enzyme
MNNLDDILDIPAESEAIAAEPVEESQALVPAEPGTMANPEKAVDNDLSYTRNKLKQIIDIVQPSLESAILVAEESGNPRAFEVVGTLVQSLVQANKELMQLHKTRADAVKTSVEGGELPKSQGDVTIEKAVFFGRAQDLLRELRKAKIEVEQEDGEV